MDFLAIFRAVAAFFGFAKQREALQNSPAMQANKTAAGDAAREEQIAREEAAADGGRLEDLRKDVAE